MVRFIVRSFVINLSLQRPGDKSISVHLILSVFSYLSVFLCKKKEKRLHCVCECSLKFEPFYVRHLGICGGLSVYFERCFEERIIMNELLLKDNITDKFTCLYCSLCVLESKKKAQIYWFQCSEWIKSNCNDYNKKNKNSCDSKIKWSFIFFINFTNRLSFEELFTKEVK